MALLPLVLCGPGCSRIKTYRAQDSPLPLLGRLDRDPASPRAIASRDREGRAPRVAWSGPPNTTPPAVKLASPRGTSPGTLALATPPPASDAGPESLEASATTSSVSDLIRTGRESLAKVRDYQVAMNRQEKVGDELGEAEDVLLSVRREPRAVRLEWLDGSHKGREVIYAAGSNGGLVHINMADSKIPLPRMTFPPDSPLVLSKSRHPIQEAGLDSILEKLETSVRASRDGDRVTHEGIVTPPEVGQPCHKLTRVTPQGQSWIIYLEADSCVPRFVQEQDGNGGLLERYAFGPMQADPPSLAEASAFDPDGRWGAPRGFFGRMATGGASANPTSR